MLGEARHLQGLLEVLEAEKFLPFELDFRSF